MDSFEEYRESQPIDRLRSYTAHGVYDLVKDTAHAWFESGAASVKGNNCIWCKYDEDCTIKKLLTVKTEKSPSDCYCSAFMEDVDEEI